MHTTQRNITWLFMGFGSMCVLGWLVNTTSPNGWPTILALFSLITVATYALAMFILNHSRRAGFITIGVVAFFLMRMAHLRQPLYSILLVAALLSLELTSKKR